MPLTIGYTILPNPDWDWGRVHDVLGKVRDHIATLKVNSVGKLTQIQGRSCQTEPCDSDETRRIKSYAKDHAICHLFPGVSRTISPDYMAFIPVVISDKCPQITIGCAQYPSVIWRQTPITVDMLEKSHQIPNWPLAMSKPGLYPRSFKHLKKFMQRWHLRKLPKGPSDDPTNIRWKEISFSYDVDRTSLARCGMIKKRGHLCLYHPLCDRALWLKHSGTPEVANRIMVSAEFHNDIRKLVEGDDFTQPASRGWRDSCVTEFAHDPSVGPTTFIHAHMTVCAILEQVQSLGFDLHVADQTNFWMTADMGDLTSAVNNHDELYQVKSIIDHVVDKVGVAMREAVNLRNELI